MSYYIGIDIGGMSIKAGVVDSEKAAILASHSVKTPQCGGDGFCDACWEAVDAAIKASGISEKEIKGIGIGAPGISDKENGVLLYVGTINYNNARVRAKLQEHLNVPVLIENDANVAAIGEYFSRRKDNKMTCFIFLTIGTGVGGGVIIGDKLYVGSNGAGAELGHIVTHKGGKVCDCGRSGCYEAYASMTALIRNANERKSELSVSPDTELNGKVIFDLADAGDKVANELINDWIEEIGEGVADMINIFQPEEIAIGGAVSAQGERLLAPIREVAYSKDFTRKLDLPHTKISAATLANEAGIIGAALQGLVL